MRNLTVDRVRPVDADNRADSDRGLERCPEMEFMRSVRLPLSCYHPSKRFRHDVALRNSSVSRIPYAILSHRPSGSESGEASAMIHRDISVTRSEMSAVTAASALTRPK